jgi:fucose permease
MGGSFAHKSLIAVVGALVLLPFLVIAVTWFPAPKQAQGFPIAAAGRLARDPFLLIAGLILFLESGMEITVGGWTSTFVNEVLDASPRTALIVLSLYWMGMMLARLALGTVLRGLPPVRLLYSCLSIGFIGATVLLMTRSLTGAGTGVFMLGIGFAATFPTILGMAGERYSELSGTAFSFVIAIALLGGMLLPLTTGILGGAYGMRGSFVIVPVAILLLGTLLTILSRRTSAATA